jgi:hypothetical protein
VIRVTAVGRGWVWFGPVTAARLSELHDPAAYAGDEICCAPRIPAAGPSLCVRAQLRGCPARARGSLMHLTTISL